MRELVYIKVNNLNTSYVNIKPIQQFYFRRYQINLNTSYVDIKHLNDCLAGNFKIFKYILC